MENLSLIEGEFTADEASEILMNVFYTKIHFHEMKNFSSQERFEVPDLIAQKRIPELKASIEKLLKMVADAKNKNARLRIYSNIELEISSDVPEQIVG